MRSKPLYFKVIIYTIIVLTVIALITGGYFAFKKDFKIEKFKKTINIEYNDVYKESPGKVCFGNLFTCNKVNYKVKGKVNTQKLDKYNIKYIYKYKNKKLILKQTVNVKDTTPPQITINADHIIVCPNDKIMADNIKIEDNYDKKLKIKKELDKEKNILLITAKDSSKNRTKKEIPIKIEDTTPPQISLKGNENIYVYVGNKYNDEGINAVDNCDDEVKIDIQNNVNYNNTGTYNIIYTATDSSNNKSEIKRNVIVKARSVSGRKIIYLTFDDGPSAYTNKLLDILKKYNVKATFFVTGKGSDSIILREYNEGHKVALHSNSHNYASIYSSVDNYFSDLNQIQSRVERITGYRSNLIRFPGGSSNTVSRSYSNGIMSKLTKEVQNRGYKYFDWNISSGDAGETTSSDRVYSNVVNHLKGDYSIVLQHDTQEFSINAVERIIRYGIDNGFTFKVLDESSPGAHHGVNN